MKNYLTKLQALISPEIVIPEITKFGIPAT